VESSDRLSVVSSRACSPFTASDSRPTGLLQANNLEEDGRLIAELALFNEPIEKITPDAMRNFIKPHGMTNINPEEEGNLQTLLDELRLPETAKNRLKSYYKAAFLIKC